MPSGRDRRPRDDDQVASGALLEIPDHSAERLTHATPHAITHDTAADGTRSGDREPHRRQPVRSSTHSEERMLELHSLAPHRGDLRVPPQTSGVHERGRARRR